MDERVKTTGSGRSRDAWANIPNALARDDRLDADALALICYRATFVGMFALHYKDVRKHISSFGRSRFYKALRTLTGLGYLLGRELDNSRRAHRCFNADERGAPFIMHKVSERVDLSASSASRNGLIEGFQQVQRAMFNGASRAEAIAIAVFLGAHAPTCNISADQIAVRFGWKSRSSVSRWISHAIDLELITRHIIRVNGRISGVAYYPAHWPVSKEQ